MPADNLNTDQIVEMNQQEQALKHLPHWPSVNIDFEDIIYTVENDVAS